MIEDGKYREVKGVKGDMCRRQWMWGVWGRGKELDAEGGCYY